MMDWIKASYQGRMGRKHFAMLVLLLTTVTLLVMQPLFWLLAHFGALGGIVSFVIGITFNLLTLHIFARRLHDVGLTGWLILLVFVPMIGMYVSLLMTVGLLFWPGNKGVNSYGIPPPAERTLRDVLWNP